MIYRFPLGVGVLLVILAQAAGAQKRGTAAPNWDKMVTSSGSAAASPVLTKKDMEEMGPVGRLLDKKKDLKLTDAQVARLKEMQAAGDVRDASLHEAMDSLRKEMRPAGGGRPSEETQMKLSRSREQFAKTVETLRANYAAESTAALEVLDVPQRPMAGELLARQRAEADETVGKKMRAGPPTGASGRRPPGQG